MHLGGQAEAQIPLQTRSMVLTVDPSSIVCSVKSISGTGLFSLMALSALSTCLALATRGVFGSSSMVAIFLIKTRVAVEEVMDGRRTV
jgi:hypothetical protein